MSKKLLILFGFLSVVFTSSGRAEEPVLEQLFKTHSAVMLLIDPKSGEIVRANRAAAEFYGYTLVELAAMKIQDINILSAEQVAIERQAALSEGRNYFIFSHRLADGDTRKVAVYSAPVILEGRRLLLSIINDISARLILQDEIWHYQGNLETLVANQTAMITAGSQRQHFMMVISIVVLCILLVLLSILLIRLRQARFKASQNSSRLSAIFDAMDDMLIFSNIDKQIVETNHSARLMFRGKSLRGREFHELALSVEETSESTRYLAWYDTDDGGFWGDTSAIEVQGEQREVLGFIHIIRDISERLKTEKQQRLASTVFATTNEGVLVADRDFKIKMVNRAFTEITGYLESELLELTPNVLNSGRHDKAFFDTLYKELHLSGRWQGEIWNRRKNGEIYPCWLSLSTVLDQSGELDMYVALFSDISSRKKNEQEMWRQANFDNLTGLANRNLFYSRFEQELLRARRHNERLAICFLDLDRFKAVNDTLGHHIGDLLLVEAARRLKAGLRETDTVARLGGDEFALLLPGVELSRDLEYIMQKLLDSLARPFWLEGHEAFVSGSIGVTLYPDDGQQRNELLRNADSAMYKAKEAGRNCYRFYTSTMHQEAQQRSLIESALHKAMERDELSLVFQPIVSTKGVRFGCEALLRWHSEELGDVSPTQFIPVCEELGLIVNIGEWVLWEACRKAKSWYTRLGPDFFISVNLSSAQFGRQNIAGLVERVLRETGLPPSALTLEITETVLVQHSHGVLVQLQQLRELGVHLAIDDFGTGYSSLSYLKRFPLSKLKIDREFIREVPFDPEACALVSAIVSMAANLNLKVIAEGVETEEQSAFLSALGCDYEQGYLYSKPLSEDALIVFLSHLKARHGSTEAVS